MINEFLQLISDVESNKPLKKLITYNDFMYSIKFSFYYLVFQSIFYIGFSIISFIIFLFNLIIVVYFNYRFDFTQSISKGRENKQVYYKFLSMTKNFLIFLLICNLIDNYNTTNYTKLIDYYYSENLYKQKFFYFTLIVALMHNILLFILIMNFIKLRELYIIKRKTTLYEIVENDSKLLKE